jgi:hypothetical protein
MRVSCLFAGLMFGGVLLCMPVLLAYIARPETVRLACSAGLGGLLVGSCLGPFLRAMSK